MNSPHDSRPDSRSKSRHQSPRQDGDRSRRGGRAACLVDLRHAATRSVCLTPLLAWAGGRSISHRGRSPRDPTRVQGGGHPRSARAPLDRRGGPGRVDVLDWPAAATRSARTPAGGATVAYKSRRQHPPSSTRVAAARRRRVRPDLSDDRQLDRNYPPAPGAEEARQNRGPWPRQHARRRSVLPSFVQGTMRPAPGSQSHPAMSCPVKRSRVRAEFHVKQPAAPQARTPGRRVPVSIVLPAAARSATGAKVV